MWRIYYDDGSIFDHGDGAFENAPADGVLFVIQRDESGRVATHSGADFYLMMEGEIISTGDIGPILRKLGFIKFGRWTTIKRYEEIGRRVTQDAKSWQS